MYIMFIMKNRTSFAQIVVGLFMFSAAHKVVFVGSGAYDSFTSFLFGRSKFRVILNGVDISRTKAAFAKRRKICSRKLDMNNSDMGRVFDFVCIGRLVDQKNLHFLIRSLALLDLNFKLHVYGVGYHLQSLKCLASELGLCSKVIFHGNVSREQVFEALANADLYLSAAVYEGLPMALMEALSIGTPCLVSDIKSHREVASFVADLKLSPLETTSFAAEIHSLLRNIPCCLPSSRHDVVQSLSMVSMQYHYSNIYMTLMEDRIQC